MKKEQQVFSEKIWSCYLFQILTLVVHKLLQIILKSMNAPILA